MLLGPLNQSPTLLMYFIIPSKVHILLIWKLEFRIQSLYLKLIASSFLLTIPQGFHL